MKTDLDTIKTDIEICQGQIKRLQHSTIECITFKPSGKVEIVDKSGLESLNGEIDRLNTLVGHNSEVAGRLQAVLEKVHLPSVAALVHAKNRSKEAITKYKIGINSTIGNWLAASPNYTVENIRDHPRVKPEVERQERVILQEESKLKLFIPALEEAQSILKDFQPSGLPEIKPERAMGMVRFDQAAPVSAL